jgi:hypothetical protein
MKFGARNRIKVVGTIRVNLPNTGPALLWAPLITRLVWAVIIWFHFEPLHKRDFSDAMSWVGGGSEIGASTKDFVNCWF